MNSKRIVNRSSFLSTCLVLLLFLFTYGKTYSQQAHVLVLGKDFGDASEELVTKFQKDLASNPDAIVITGDWMRKKYRLNNNPLLNSDIGELLATYSGQIFLVPGEDEYGPYQNNSIARLSDLEESLSEIQGNYIHVPQKGCPGPYTISTNDWVLMFINTARFLHQGDKIPFFECELEDEAMFFNSISDELSQYQDRPVFIVGHHPVRSRGPHAGYFPAYQHLLPPVLSTIYIGFRKYIGGLQDLNDERYRKLTESLLESFASHNGIYYISGHEPYFHADLLPDAIPRSQIIAGSFRKTSQAKPVQTDDGQTPTTIISSNPGYVRIMASKSTKEDNRTNVTVVHRNLGADLSLESTYKGEIQVKEEIEVDTTFIGETTTAFATRKLDNNMKKPGLMGFNYRSEWSASISNVPVFDLGVEQGGFKIVKKGGGMQTKSLRLEAKNGRQYVLRTVEKFPVKAVPLELRGTIAEEVIADQISASHPYAALAVPKLADAAGVYHSNPSLVYLPNDPRLGEYAEDFAEGLYLYEERADDDFWQDAEYFGNPEDIVSTTHVLEKLRIDGDHIIDEAHVIRSRLFDIWIGDWDRHDDQWRWAKYWTEKDEKIYRPIPRDRDQVFFWSDGSMLKLASRKWGMPKFQPFEEEIRDVGGHTFNARFFDRTFITESEQKDWMTIARNLQSALTDSIIESGVHDLPPEIFALNGNTIIRKLKRRRDDLQKYAREYYEFLSKTVVVTGTQKAEEFNVSYFKDSTIVDVYRIKEGSGERKYLSYSRKFIDAETSEVRLFGFEGDDRFVFTGDASDSPKIRIIGGQGNDSLEVIDNRHRAKIVLYDKKNTPASGVFKDHRSDETQVNEYNRNWFKYNKVLPLVTGEFNLDDGLFIGGGVLIQKQGFRKDPFASQHRITATFAPISSSYTFSYKGEWSDVFRFTDVVLEVDVSEPSYGDYFYGFGNQTEFNDSARDENRQFYWVRYSTRAFNPKLRVSSTNGHHVLTYGPSYRSVKIRSDQNNGDDDRFITLYSEFVGRGEEAKIPFLDTRRYYLGANFNYSFDLRDSKTFPRSGMYWDSEVNLSWQLGDEEFVHQRLSSSMAFYFTFGGKVKATLAGRVGGQVNLGDFEFYQSARLGGGETLRGYRKLRFAGDQSFYNNMELRVQVLSFKSILFPALAGFNLFADHGRVWSDSPNNVIQDPTIKPWHRGLGVGLWIAPLGQIAVNAEYSWSNNNEDAFFVRFGFFF